MGFVGCELVLLSPYILIPIVILGSPHQGFAVISATFQVLNQMPGARISPVGVINQIADNLRDRYDSGFPVLKEIIQNADDARASNLVMGWSQGIEGAENPLLRDPALFFINNAPLEEEHANGIMSVAEGSKANAKASVGKFGLGMKSLFHLCEAFFFAASTWGENEWAANVFNPWAEFRPDWDTFTDTDKAGIQARLNPVLQSFVENKSPWFVVWVPLRTREQIAYGYDEAIIGHYEESSGAPSFLCEPDLPQKIADIFPLLKCLKKVELLIEHEGDFVSRFNVALKKGSERSKFQGESVFADESHHEQWRGHVMIHSSGTESVLEYAGVESLLTLESLRNLREEEKGWPVSYQNDSESGRPRKAPDKAEQHVAVVISRTPAAGQAIVTASWAVFLPLAVTKELPAVAIGGEYNYHFHLHGYFFVDAGRKGIHGHADIGQDANFTEINGDEKLLRRAWNLTLANEGTLDQLLPSFKNLIESFKIKREDINHVSGGIKNLLPFRYLFRSAAKYSWIYRMMPEKQAWELVKDDSVIRLLPRPAADDYQRVWNTFPWLAENADSICFAEQEKNNIVSKESLGWTLEDLEGLLAISVTEVFTAKENLGYLNSFLSLNQSFIGNASFIQGRLIRIVRDALASIPLSELSKQTAGIQLFIGYILPGKRLSLSVEKYNQELWQAICAVDTEVFIVPAFLDSSNSRSSAPINVSDAVKILKALDRKLRTENSSGSPVVEAAERVISKILDDLKKSSRKDYDAVCRDCGELRLFGVYDLRKAKNRLMSRNKLIELQKESRLFLRSGISFGLGLGKELLDAIQSDIYFLTKETAVSLFGDSELKECNQLSALTCLSYLPGLAPEHKRRNLLEKFSGDLSNNIARKGFRYLLHGSREDNDTQKLWMGSAQDESIWATLWRMNAPSERPEWSVIPRELSDVLTPAMQKNLNIHQATSREVISEWERNRADENVDFVALDMHREDIYTILNQVEDCNLWRRLPLHKGAAEGELIAIDETCVLEVERESSIPENLDIVQIKRAIHDGVAQKQREFIGEAKPEQLVKIALHQQSPVDHACFIVNTLVEIQDQGGHLSYDVSNLLRKTPWLVMDDGKVVSLSQVLFVPKDTWPVTVALCDEDGTACYHVEQLDSNLFNNEKHIEVLKQYAINIRDNYDLIFKEASRFSQYDLGEIKQVNDVAIKQISDCPDVQTILPGWALVCELTNNLNEYFDTSVIGSLFRSPSDLQLVEALNSFALHPVQRTGEARVLFLEAICALNSPVAALKRVKLRTKSNDYKSSQTLTINVVGVGDSDTLHDAEWRVIKKVLAGGHTKPAVAKHVGSNEYKNRVTLLTRYFDAWNGYVPLDAVAMFLTVFSSDDETARLAERYFRRFSLQGTWDEYNKLWDSELARTGKKSASFKKMVMVPSICDGDKLQVNSIFGHKTAVSLQENPDSILLFDERDVKTNNESVFLQMRKIDLEKLSKEQRLKLIKTSIELVFSKIFGLNISLDELWRKLGESSQKDIEFAQEMVLEDIVSTLNRLNAKDAKVSELLKQYKKAQRYKHESGRGDEGKINKVKRELKKYIITNESIQKLILDGVRQEIGERAQYTTDSVPFELFQNADDAFGERKKMLKGKNNIPASQAKFIVRHEPSALSFYHWGRDINYCDPSYAQGKDSFEYDLEKMVTLNGSDKGEGATGKFGLGFKSCLLICDSPSVMSGDLVFDISGGVLPFVSTEANKKILVDRVNQEEVGSKKPTLIRLALNEKLPEVSAEKILTRFERSAGLLCVFSKHIRTIDMREKNIHWTPKESGRIKGLFFGKAYLPQEDNSLKAQKVVHYKTENGQFLFQLGEKGLTSLENRKISKFWVLNPIDEAFQAGFIVEGDFQIDIGRSRLANNNRKNGELMGKLGRDLAGLFEQIHAWIVADWQGFCAEWSLREQLDPAEFWGSVWNVLTTKWPLGLPSEESKSVLFQTLFTAPRGLWDFYSCHALVPHRLGHEKNSLISLNNVHSQTDSVLAQAYQYISELPKLAEYRKKQSLVDDRLGSQIAAINPNKPLRTLLLLNVIAMHANHNRVDQALAGVLGKLFNDNVKENLRDALVKQTEELRTELSQLEFQCKNPNYWGKAESLVIFEGNASPNEESLMAKFSPDYGVLSANYNKNGQAFFKWCRIYSKPALDEWLRTVSGKEKQEALLRYIIADFNGSRQLAKKLRKDGGPAWLHAINAAVLKNTFGWGVRDIDTYLHLMEGTERDSANRVAAAMRNSTTSLSPKEALERIYDWWSAAQYDEIPRYENRLYSQPLPWEEMRSDELLESIETRKGWLKLLYLGACQTIGRVTEGHHRMAMQWMDAKGWWDKMAQQTMEPGDWTDIIDQYLKDAQLDESYRMWLQIVPLYNFSKNLEHYVDMFQNVDRMPQLDDLLKSSESALWQGTGEHVPALRRSLGIGANFIIRELIRYEITPEIGAHNRAFVLSERVRRVIARVGYNSISDSADPYESENVFDYFYSKLLDDRKATFDSCFDIPFRCLADNESLMQNLLEIGVLETA